MDNEGLLVWAEYEVQGAWAVLKRTEKNRDELRKIVKLEKDKEANDMDALTLKVCAFIKQETARIRRKNELSREEYEQVEQKAEAQKAFLRKGGVSEEELKEY